MIYNVCPGDSSMGKSTDTLQPGWTGGDNPLFPLLISLLGKKYILYMYIV